MDDNARKILMDARCYELRGPKPLADVGKMDGSQKASPLQDIMLQNVVPEASWSFYAVVTSKIRMRALVEEHTKLEKACRGHAEFLYNFLDELMLEFTGGPTEYSKKTLDSVQNWYNQILLELEKLEVDTNLPESEDFNQDHAPFMQAWFKFVDAVNERAPKLIIPKVSENDLVKVKNDQGNSSMTHSAEGLLNSHKTQSNTNKIFKQSTENALTGE